MRTRRTGPRRRLGQHAAQ